MACLRAKNNPSTPSCTSKGCLLGHETISGCDKSELDVLSEATDRQQRMLNEKEN